MQQIGIRELRQHASRWVRRVASGESFEVTDRGRPVARLTPLPAATGVARLRDEGRITEAEGDLLKVGRLFPHDPDLPLPSERLRELREHER